MTDIEQLPLNGSHWGTYRVETRDGDVTKLHPFEQDQDPSDIGLGIVDVLDGPTRIQSPMVRKSWLDCGPGSNNHLRGIEPFVQVSWDVANKLIATEITRIKSEFGNKAIFGGSYGWSSAGRFHHAQSQLHRFLNSAGGYTRSLNTYSFAAGEVMVPHVLGTFRPFVYGGPTWKSVVENAELVVAFGGIRLPNGQINPGGVGRHTQRESLLAARAAGLEFVNVSPIKSDLMAEVDSEWIAPRPSSDTALLLGLAHTIVSEGLHDQRFLDEFTVGFERFAPYLLGETDGMAKSAEWASELADIDADTIRDLARRMASSRTILSISWSLTRQDHGEQAYWAAIALAAMLGQVGLPGRGIAFGFSAVNAVGNNVTDFPAAALPQGFNPVGDFIPVARISDMLLNPGTEFRYDGKTHTYPDIKLMWWCGGNPFHHHQDLGKMMKAWQRPDTIIVNEWCWNANAKFADIVLPCTTPLERNDITMTGYDPIISTMSKVIEPVGEARDDYDIFTGIAVELGIEESFTQAMTSEEWISWIYAETRDRCAKADIELPTQSQLETQRWFEIDAPVIPRDEMQRFRSGEPLHTPSGKIEIFSETVDSFGDADCGGHPTWYEPIEWLGSAADGYPLHLISNQPAGKLHSQLDHGSVSRATKLNGREPITIHSQVALTRGLEAGDLVRVFNTRGGCLASVVIDDGLRPDVVQLSTGSWFDPVLHEGQLLCKHGNPNALTKDIGTSSLTQGPTAHSCLVQIERYVGPEMSVTAFDPPEIEQRR